MPADGGSNFIKSVNGCKNNTKNPTAFWTLPSRLLVPGRKSPRIDTYWARSSVAERLGQEKQDGGCLSRKNAGRFVLTISLAKGNLVDFYFRVVRRSSP